MCNFVLRATSRVAIIKGAVVAVAVAVLFFGGAGSVYAQDDVDSGEGTFEDVIKGLRTLQESVLLPGKTLGEQFDYGVTLGVVAGGFALLSVGFAVGFAVQDNPTTVDEAAAIGGIAGSLVGMLGFGIAAWVYVADADDRISGRVSIGEQEHGVDVLLAFEGTGVRLLY